MAETPLDYDDIRDLRYNPFTGEFTPKQIGYGGNPPETRIVPSSSPYIIKLYESPQELVPSKTRIIRNDTGTTLTEQSKTTTPSTNQYRVNYDELGNGMVEFHPSLAGKEVDISYYGLGHLFQKISLDTRVPSTGDTTIAGNKTLSGDNSHTGSNVFQGITCTTIKTNDDWCAIEVGASHGDIGPGGTDTLTFTSVQFDNNSNISSSTIVIPREAIYMAIINKFQNLDGTFYYRVNKNGSPQTTTICELAKYEASDVLTFGITNTSGGTLLAASDITIRFVQISNWLK